MLEKPGTQTLTLSKGADSVDYAVPADYSMGSEMESAVFDIID